ncbi:MAG: universal stress protein [Pseudanabaenales cyanobacterium]|nr:universal stress protein [Pseudanabaenales cyanobacterium]
MMAFKKILVAIDRSPQADAIFEQALDMAQNLGSSLLIFHGLHPESDVRTDYLIGVGTLGDLGLYGQTRRRQQAHLQKRIADIHNWLQGYCQDAIIQGIPADLMYRIGEPGPEICEAARNYQVDLIVMGRRGLQGLSEMVLGSVSNYVVHHAPCAVLIVQEKESITGGIESSQS